VCVGVCCVCVWGVLVVGCYLVCVCDRLVMGFGVWFVWMCVCVCWFGERVYVGCVGVCVEMWCVCVWCGVTVKCVWCVCGVCGERVWACV